MWVEFQGRSWLKIQTWKSSLYSHHWNQGVEWSPGESVVAQPYTAVWSLESFSSGKTQITSTSTLLRKFRQALLWGTVWFLLSFDFFRKSPGIILEDMYYGYLVFCMWKLEKSIRGIKCRAFPIQTFENIPIFISSPEARGAVGFQWEGQLPPPCWQPRRVFWGQASSACLILLQASFYLLEICWNLNLLLTPMFPFSSLF